MWPLRHWLRVCSIYASPVWWGFIDAGSRNEIEAVIRRLRLTQLFALSIRIVWGDVSQGGHCALQCRFERFHARPKCLLSPLSGVLRAAARLILLLTRTSRVADRICTELHWLDIPSRVTFKLCVLAYRCLHGPAPAYLVRYFTPVSAIAGRSHLRSAASGLLSVRRTNTSTIGPRAFAISSPTTWNCLPVDLRDPGHCSLLTFRRKLKTHLFNLSSF